VVDEKDSQGHSAATSLLELLRWASYFGSAAFGDHIMLLLQEKVTVESVCGIWVAVHSYTRLGTEEQQELESFCCTFFQQYFMEIAESDLVILSVDLWRHALGPGLIDCPTEELANRLISWAKATHTPRALVQSLFPPNTLFNLGLRLGFTGSLRGVSALAL
jgi:hypothetical protein